MCDGMPGVLFFFFLVFSDSLSFLEGIMVSSAMVLLLFFFCGQICYFSVLGKLMVLVD